MASRYDDECLDDNYYNDVDYEENDGYGDEQEITEEERILLDEATTAVQLQLAKAPVPIKAPIKDIEDTVWYYEFDVDKSVGYLAKKYAVKTPTKPKQQPRVGKSKFELAAEKRAAVAASAPPSNGTPVTAALQTLKIHDMGLLPSTKKIDVVREWRRRANPRKEACFVVVGHVDHGKSTLMGRLLLAVGAVDERTIRKYRKEAEIMGKASFAYAWVMDSGSEERERGVTIDIAAVPFETATTCFTILDAPGHADFTPNMITGSTFADCALLCVDASTGALESGLRGQTKVHTLLLRSMGVTRVIVAVNKMDMVDWDAERYNDAVTQITALMRSLKFRIDRVSFIPVSGLEGENLVERTTHPKAAWYGGPSLLEELETVTFPTEDVIERPLRMEVLDLAAKDFVGSAAVTGRIQQGHVQVGEAVLLQPSGQPAHVKAIVAGRGGGGGGGDSSGNDTEFAVAGQYVKLFLTNIDPAHVRVGDTVCSAVEPIPCVRFFTVKALAFESILPLTGELVRGRLQVEVSVRPLSLLHPKTGDVLKVHPQMLKKGQFGRLSVRLVADAKLPLESGQRVVIRHSDGVPIAAGMLD